MQWSRYHAFIGKKNVQECHCIGKRIIHKKIKYDDGQLEVLNAYAPKEGEKEKTEMFHHKMQKLSDKSRNYEILIIGNMKARAGKTFISNIVGVFGEELIMN